MNAHFLALYVGGTLLGLLLAYIPLFWNRLIQESKNEK